MVIVMDMVMMVVRVMISIMTEMAAVVVWWL